MDDVEIEFFADLFIAERISERTGETLVQFIERKQRELRKGVNIHVEASGKSVAGLENGR